MATSTQPTASHKFENVPADEQPSRRPPGRRSSTWRTRLRQVPTHLVLLPLAIVWVYPFIWMVSTAFKAESPLADVLRIVPETFTSDNFSRAWDVGNLASTSSTASS